MRLTKRKWWIDLTIGQVFDTRYEQCCKVVTLPDEQGNFEGYDSDGVLCTFHMDMVIALRGLSSPHTARID